MSYQVKVKTGFYKTVLYTLKISHESLIFSPIEKNGKAFQLGKEELISIVMIDNKHSKIRINTNNNMIEGIFIEKIDMLEFQKKIKENIKSTIIIEEG